MEPELVGEDFSVDPFQTECSDLIKRGRPSQIDPEKLRRDVIELQFALEQNWGEVGWLLLHAKTESDVQTAFRKIVNPRCNLLEPFIDEKTQQTTGTGLRKLRKRAMELTERHRQNFAHQQSARRRCETAFDPCESDPFKRAQIQAARVEFARDYEEADSLMQTSRVELEALEAELKESESFFAQSEILRFLESNRRRFTPLNVARAMAGLPFVTARVSCELCTKYEINPPHGMAFEIFRVIERAFREPIRDLGRSIESMRNYLLSGRDNDLAYTAQLRKNWHFLDSAIRSAARDTRAPRDSFAFRTFAEYCRVSTSHTAAEALIADALRLFIDGENREMDTRLNWSAPRKAPFSGC